MSGMPAAELPPLEQQPVAPHRCFLAEPTGDPDLARARAHA